MSKERNMSPKGFLHKANGKAANSAAAFLAAHRAWLETGNLASLTSPVLAKLDKNEILPTPALAEIKAIVFGHMIASETKRVEDAQAKREMVGEAPAKNWIATVYDGKNQVVIAKNDDGKVRDLTQGFDKASDADRWAERRLVDCAPDCYAVVHSDVHNSKTIITRDEAMNRQNPREKMAVHKSKPKSTPRLGFGVKAKQDHCHFSRG